jgi:hypothetical protein
VEGFFCLYLFEIGIRKGDAIRELGVNFAQTMSIDKKLKLIRTSARQNSRLIINHIVDTKISRLTPRKMLTFEICSFCGAKDNLTKEHVIPQWTYESSTEKFFTTNMNGLDQTYNKTTVPACAECNNERLSSLELYLTQTFSKINLPTEYFDNDDLSHIIRWLEIIDYKFQVLNAKRIFLAHKEKGYFSSLADIPLSILRESVNYSPSKAVTEIRRSLKRLTIKDKSQHLNSLTIFKTKNKGFHFFHKMDDFIFIEIPQFKIALFYFYKKTFKTLKSGQRATKKIIDQVY